jgi:Domain of unknown function (DUF4384)
MRCRSFFLYLVPSCSCCKLFPNSVNARTWASSVADIIEEAIPGSRDYVSEITTEAQKIANPNGMWGIQLKTEKGQSAYRIGDTVTSIFTAERGRFVTLLNIGTNGRTTVLFRNIWHIAHKIEKGRTSNIPSDDRNFRVRMTGPVGKERVKAVAALKYMSTRWTLC